MKQIVLKSALWISALWDLITTLLGTLLLLGSNGFVQIGISLVGTLIVGAFNFSTKSIWKPGNMQTADAMTYVLLKVIWLMAIAFDLLTSLVCNAAYVAYQGINIGRAPIQLSDILPKLNDSQVIVILFVTVLATASPTILGYISNQEIDFFGQ